MSRTNRGKQFEESVKTAIEAVPDTTIIRLYDPQAGHAGIRNICDFVAYRYPHQYLLECKSCYGNTFPLTNITPTQWQGLLDYVDVPGVIAGILLWFIDHDLTLFISIGVLQRVKAQGYKSVNARKLEQLEGEYTEIPGRKKRVLYEYDMKGFLGN